MRPRSALGVWLAVLVAAPACLPSLVPRSGPIQGLLSGVLLALGYGAGALLRARPEPGKRTWLGASAILLGSLALGWHWQREVAAASTVAPPGPIWIASAAVVAASVFALLLATARGVRHLTVRTDRGLQRLTSPQVARVGAVGFVAIIAVALVGRLPQIVSTAGKPLFERMNASNMSNPPTSDFVSGGPASQIPWQGLGSQGRAFVSGATSAADLRAFSGRPARNPIRVFAGVDCADSNEQRAAMAVADLERLGAFQRAVIAVGTSAGSGTVDPGEVVPLEYLLNGDVATVSTQYSILPSFLSILVDTENSIEASRTLFEAVRQRADEQPPGSRPKVVVFGESLGAYGANGAFPDLASLLQAADGAMFQGPPNSTRMWRELSAARQPGSAEIRPVYDDGQHVRWANQPADLDQPAGPFESPRVVYLQNASDPVVWWTPSLLVNRPDWLREPRGPGVLAWLPWLPVYTFAGLTGDMINSQGVPAGHGHVYGTDPVVAWSHILAPVGWTDADTVRLQTRLGG